MWFPVAFLGQTMLLSSPGRAAKSLVSTNSEIRVLLAEDHALFRQGLRELLDAAGLAVIGEASDGVNAVRLTR